MTVLQHEPPFTKRRAGKLAAWSTELDLAFDFAQREGLTFRLCSAPYQVAKLTGEGVRVLIYPHKTKSTGHISLRVRDENSANRERADRIMSAMNDLAPYCNTFSRNNSVTRWERDRAHRQAAS